ncbi:MAG: hypothetical protein ABI910_22920 [Gemmatimonadota bacterium]
MAALVLGGMFPLVAAAQTRPISLWLGAGRQVAHDSVSFSLRKLDAYGAVQLDIPLLPVALRGDISFAGSALSSGTRNVSTSVILPLRLPIIQPYAMLGYGIYDWGKSAEARGISYGAGVRLQLGGLGVFAQVRRHEVLDRSMGTLGLVF